MLRFVESILSEVSTFYDFVQTELHNRDDVDIWSDEPLGSNYSCFDYAYEGDDRDKDQDYDRRFYWRNCRLTMDDDGLYWKSKSGKSAALTIYSIVKIQTQPRTIKVWVAPTDNADEMSVVEFTTKHNWIPISERGSSKIS